MSAVGSAYAHFNRFVESQRLSRLRRANGGSERIRYLLPCEYTMDLRFGDRIAQRMLLSDTFEPAVSTAILTLVRPGMVVLDVGANIGVHALHMARRVGMDGTVLAFEPNPTAREELLRNISLNNIENVKVLNLALWNEDGEELFCFPSDGLEAMGGLRQNSQFKAASQAKVATARIDTVLARHAIQHVDFIKIDVEGAELQVLEGAGSLLDDERRPPILYESALINSQPYSYTPDDLSRYLIAKGYQVEKIDEANYLALPSTTW